MEDYPYEDLRMADMKKMVICIYLLICHYQDLKVSLSVSVFCSFLNIVLTGIIKLSNRS